MMIAGFAATYGSLVNGQYMIAAGAFDGLLHRGFKIKMMLDHEGEQIGEWVKMSSTDRGLFVVGCLTSSPRAMMAMAKVESGECRGLSLGPKIGLRKEMEGGISLCAEVLAVPEISIVDLPGDPMALISHFCVGSA